MKALIILTGIITSVLAKHAPPIEKRANACYGDLGCFSSGAPFWSIHRPLSVVPLGPDWIKVKFMLYTRANARSEQILKGTDASTITSSHFDPTKQTKFIVHGFIDTGKTTWLHHMKDQILTLGEYNVIIVDWGGGSQLPYTQATANTRVVGAVIARLVKLIVATNQAKSEDFHLIGHSLGSHVCGYAGERITNLGRISGLDPAGPYFTNTDKVVRLDPTDAMFVDNIHTNGPEILLSLSYGMLTPVGHVDFYPNGGSHQPGCSKSALAFVEINGLFEGVKQAVACSHLRAYDLFSDSVNSMCQYSAFQCNSYSDFENGRCLPSRSVDSMGFHADKNKPKPGLTHVKYYLDTASNEPYCRHHYQITIKMAPPSSSSKSRDERGALYGRITGTNGQSKEFTLDAEMYVYPGKTYSFMVMSQNNLGKITEFDFRWKQSSSWLKPWEWNIFNLRHPTLFIEKITIDTAGTATMTNFCTTNLAVETDQKKLLYPSQTSC